MRISAKLEAWLARIVARVVDARVSALEARLAETEARLAAALPAPVDVGPFVTAIRRLEAALHPETVATRLRDPIEAMVAEALRVPLPPRPRTRTYGPAGRAFTWMVRQT